MPTFQVYYLAAVRLQDLCERVHLDEKGRHRVWTLFEHVLRTETSLMAGRHLDQNLMCCLYVVAKISKQDVSFHNIMYHYRHQPQASSRVYRQVLIDHTPFVFIFLSIKYSFFCSIFIHLVFKSCLIVSKHFSQILIKVAL